MIEIPINGYMNISSSLQNIRLTASQLQSLCTHSSNDRPNWVPPKQAGHRCRRTCAHSVRAGDWKTWLVDGDDGSVNGGCVD
jgi:hypothetical protein